VKKRRTHVELYLNWASTASELIAANCINIFVVMKKVLAHLAADKTNSQAFMKMHRKILSQLKQIFKRYDE
jgi:hypothetical protein